jgi:2-polyprenyl-3-methyl-5-hydroxy-6-metoxy-1,4-benzoquinol methylase
MIRDRRVQAELMDQPDLDQAMHVHALRGLKRINTISRTPSILWPTIADLAASIAPATLRVLDVACGGGDNAVSIARRAKQAGLPIEVDGCDLSSRAVSEARRRANEVGVDNVNFFRLDALAQRFPDGYHILMSSLFLHHLSEENAVKLLGKMAAAASRAAMICDLQRTWLGYGLAWVGCRLLTRSPVVHVDGPRSVAAAFAASEICELAARGGLDGALITNHWPQRWLLVWRRR